MRHFPISWLIECQLMCRPRHLTTVQNYKVLVLLLCNQTTWLYIFATGPRTKKTQEISCVKAPYGGQKYTAGSVQLSSSSYLRYSQYGGKVKRPIIRLFYEILNVAQFPHYMFRYLRRINIFYSNLLSTIFRFHILFKRDGQPYRANAIVFQPQLLVKY